MIPKRIFYVWGAGEKKKREVQICIHTWRQIMPDYEIIEINEDSYQYFNFGEELKQNNWFRVVYERKMWAYVADYIRIKTLYDHGGIYLDTDVSAVKPLDRFLHDPAFVGMQRNSQEAEGDYVEPAVLGSEKGNIFLKHILDFYEKKIWEEPIYRMPQIFQYFLSQCDDIKEFQSKQQQIIIKLKYINIYPERYFIPFRFREEFSAECIEENTYTIHWWGQSWFKPEIMYFLENKNKKSIKEIDHDLAFQSEKIQLFGLFPCCVKAKGKKEYWYVCKIRIIKIIRTENKIEIYLFGFLPIFKIKKAQYT